MKTAISVILNSLKTACTCIILLFFSTGTLLIIPLSGQVIPENILHDWITTKASTAPFHAVSLEWNATDTDKGKNDQILSQAVYINLDKLAYAKVFDNLSANISLTLPLEPDKTTRLLLSEVSLYEDGFELRIAEGKKATLPKGKFYRGIIEDDVASIAAVSFFEDRIHILVSNSSGNFVLGKVGTDTDSAQDQYVLYNDQNLLENNPLLCQLEDSDFEEAIGNKTFSTEEKSNASTRCLTVYLECDYALYRSNNWDRDKTFTYVNGLFNEVAAIYQNEHFDLRMAGSYIWNIPDPYQSFSSIRTILEKFKNRKNSLGFDGDLALLLSTRGIGGGIAYLNGLCRNTNFAVCGIKATFESVPVYSWSVNVVSHEIGHILGSFHTQNCVWNGNNTQIDDCSNLYFISNRRDDNGNGIVDDVSEADGGSCFDSSNPIIPDIGGTIMSYCHLRTARQ